MGDGKLLRILRGCASAWRLTTPATRYPESRFLISEHSTLFAVGVE
jgi:hypothetical protein